MRFVRDLRDAHVVALALAASAGCIVTSNEKDFKVPQLGRLGIAVMNPVRFLLDLLGDIPYEVMATIAKQIPPSKPYAATSHDILSLIYREGCRTVRESDL